MKKEREFPQAKAIWLDPKVYPHSQVSRHTIFEEEKDPYAIACFQKSFEISKEIKKATCRICADSHYCFFLNGKPLQHGPAQAGGDYGFQGVLSFRFLDTFPFQLKKGKNDIKVLVSKDPVYEAETSTGNPFLVLEIEIKYLDNTKEFISTSKDWYADQDISYLSPFSISSALVQRKHHAIEKDISVTFYQKEIKELQYKSRFLYQKENQGEWKRSSHFHLSSGEGLIFSLKKVYAGYFSLNYHFQGKEGTLHLINEEVLGKRIDFRNTGDTVFHLKKGKYSFHGLELTSACYFILKLEGEGTIDGTLSFKEAYNPVNESYSFSCSDPYLNQLYDVSVRTARLCLNTYHMDSPVHQENLGCIGDYLIQSLISNVSFRDFSLIRFDLKKIAHYVLETKKLLFMINYAFLYPIWLENYYQETKDRETVKECFPAVCFLLNGVLKYQDNTGLLSLPNYMFLDWVWRDKYTLHHPPKVMGQSSSNAFYYGGLQAGIRLAKILHEQEKESLWIRQSKNLFDAFQTYLYDENKGLYIDGLEENEGEPKDDYRPFGKGRFFSLHTNVLVVLFGLNKTSRKEILKKVLEDKSLPEPTPYFEHFVFEALAKEGIYEEYAFSRFEKWKTMLEESPTSLREIQSNAFYCDDSHAWCGTPTYQLVHYILGLNPDGTITPHLGPLTYAECTIPYESYLLYCRVERTKNGYRIKQKKQSYHQ